jgi:uncharacterized membrane protein YraQ (UPF0718 family)
MKNLLKNIGKVFLSAVLAGAVPAAADKYINGHTDPTSIIAAALVGAGLYLKQPPKSGEDKK